LWLEERIEVIYEAAFQFEGVLAALDILVLANGKYYAYEVKSSTEIKEYHYNDASLQYWVLKGCGIKVEDFFIVHINNEYMKDGEIDVDQLFTKQSVLTEILDMQRKVYQEVMSMKQMFDSRMLPEIEIGEHCDKPFACDFQGHCWKTLPENSVFDLVRAGKKSWDLYDKGIIEIKNISDEEELSDSQRIQVDGVKHGTEVFDKNEVGNFLGEWKFPLYFLDFETIFPGVPIYDSSRPYQQLPFQYSLHVLKENGKLLHYEYLAETDGTDPREEIMERLIDELETKGSIVAYNASFEISCMNGIADLHPKFRKAVDLINERVVDLLIPFRNRWVYKPQMGKSASIKYVLPALVPELSYDDLDIKEGGTASATFENMVSVKSSFSQHKAKSDLLKYCKLDTLAMVEIYKVLVKEL